MSWMVPAITAVTGLISGIAGNRARKKEAEKAHQRQQELNRQGQELGMKTWRETNYAEQAKELDKAGLNPGLLYGMGGAGGGTVASGSGGSAQQAQIENVGEQLGGMALLGAQKR